jgi:quercetin dioxygenase-like cupin family protein
MSRVFSRKRVVMAGALGALAFGATAYAALNNTIGIGALEYSEAIGGPATITMRTLTIAPGEVLGWHAHPGIGAYTIVTKGTLTVEDGCGFETVYGPSQAFIEPPGRVHRGKNLTAGEVVTAQTFVVPMGDGTSHALSGPRCGRPLVDSECKNGGWASFDYPHPFANQGDCEQYVKTARQ